jgi:hypothetical protein
MSYEGNKDLQSARLAEFHSAERASICRGAAVPAVGPPDILSGVRNSADRMSAPRLVSQRPVSRI